MQSERRVVLVVGCPRSGTSVTKKIVRRHSQLAGCGVEHHYILEMLDRFGDSRFTYGDGLEVLERGRGHAGDELVDNAISSVPAGSTFDVAEFCEAVWDASTGDNDAAVLLQYAGPGLLRAPEMLTLFPNARFIVLTRDPRANISSQMLGLGEDRSTFRSINLWKECRAATAKLFAERPDVALDVPYEAFVADTAGWLRKICTFLELPWEDGLVEFDVPMATIAVDGEVKRSSFDHLDPAMNTKWRQALKPAQVSLIETMCRSEMKDLGYEPTGRRLTIGDLPWMVGDFIRWARARLRSAMD